MAEDNAPLINNIHTFLIFPYHNSADVLYRCRHCIHNEEISLTQFHRLTFLIYGHVGFFACSMLETSTTEFHVEVNLYTSYTGHDLVSEFSNFLNSATLSFHPIKCTYFYG